MASPGVVASPAGPVMAEPGGAAPVRLLFFGTIRPYKGLEVLVDAFDVLASLEPGSWRLTVVGESWEGWTLPLEKIARSAHAEHITVDTRYVPDEELPGLFRQADLVVLPYRRAPGRCQCRRWPGRSGRCVQRGDVRRTGQHPLSGGGHTHRSGQGRPSAR
jgi:hypothetical protein